MLVSRRCVAQARMGRKLHLIASRHRKTNPRMMRKRQTPKYWATVFGMNAIEYIGVLLALKKVIIIDWALIVLWSESWSMELVDDV